MEDGRLTLFAEEPSPGGPAPSPLQTIDLRSGHVHVDADVACSEVPQLARRDLPYVFKVGLVLGLPVLVLILGAVIWHGAVVNCDIKELRSIVILNHFDVLCVTCALPMCL